MISATSRDLSADIGTGIFREDLYFRLNVFNLQLPPLRERVDDVPLLVDYFLKRYGNTDDNRLLRVEPDAMRCLLAYHWPGNVRELENALERACILCENDRITADCLPATVRLADGKHPEGSSSDEDLSIKKAEILIERELIKKALTKTCGNRTHAAKILEISHRSLLYKLKEYGIE